ncbi:MAG: 2-succinyl-5-enolpyruvyl-6-hydroxy-3-cyclohexene-1-carboxylic-acid synthase [Muribaculaceae bacterium]|nr:2-succinyl-5-enolpyruvyl-6-hydroxy-3-cyclohexene-1-carboxylic-acid synthase [Muribaculaceae bacterium]
MDENTAFVIPRILSRIASEHGVRYAVVSPGSRNAPILVALSRDKAGLHVVPVIDERSAAFVALGIASVTGKPVVLVCTSGTALLNYAPAVAEAYYRRIPLIVISADRPAAWIDQDDSQTLRQPGALANFTKRNYDLTSVSDGENLWYANRAINDALLCAMDAPSGPVHINIQLSEPLGAMSSEPLPRQRVIRAVEPRHGFTVAESRAIGRELASPCRVMILAGFHNPDMVLNRALCRLSLMPNVVVLCETISNLHSPRFISAIDSTLSVMSREELHDLKPDVIITLGGALVSRHVKQYIRSHPPREHWHVSESDRVVDCFQSLTRRIIMPPALLFRQLASAMQPHRAPCSYAHLWEVVSQRAFSMHQAYVARAPWTDLKAFATFIPMIPRRWNVHFSNGTPIRYAQLFGRHEYHRCDCNRGVSGIDGCTSTAIGASLAVSSTVTLLITGDMSASYDVGALASRCITPRFKMIVMLNSGGGIFRFIGSTRSLPEREELFCVPPVLPFQELAAGYGFAYFSAASEEELRHEFPAFVAERDRPAIMAVECPPELSAEVLTGYFRRAESLG